MQTFTTDRCTSNPAFSMPARVAVIITSLLCTVVFHADVSLASEPSEHHDYIQSLLVDKEMPLLGIKWGGDIFVDVPLNNEPENASVTLRRAQLHFRKGFGRKWSARLTVKHNNAGGLELGDNYLQYSGFQTASIQFGVFDPPFSLESLTESAGLTFMEESLVVASMSETKSGGVGILKRTSNAILNAGLFFLNPKQQGVAQPGRALVLHYVHSPINILGREDLHLGGSFSYRVARDSDSTEFKSRPEIATADDYFVDTGDIPGVDKVLRLGLEAHKEFGRLSWQTELISTAVKRTGFENVVFWGGYTFVSWFLTDDARNYDAGSGSFDAMKPSHPLGKGGKGAFELALRASYVDLNDEDIVGGRQSNISLGLNWYLHSRFRVMANVVKVLDVDRPGSEFDGLNPLIFALRLQWQML